MKLRYFLIVLVVILSLLSWLIWAKVPDGTWAFIDEKSTLDNFHVLAELIFGVNLLVTALIAFGRLAGSTVQQWVDHEKLRVIPSLAECEDFKEIDFKNELENIERSVLSIIKRVNKYVLGAVILAVAIIIVFSFAAAFRPKLIIENTRAFWFFVIVCSPVPVGFLLHILIRSYARIKMWINSREANALLRLVRPDTTAEKVAQKTADLKNQIWQARRDGE